MHKDYFNAISDTSENSKILTSKSVKAFSYPKESKYREVKRLKKKYIRENNNNNRVVVGYSKLCAEDLIFRLHHNLTFSSGLKSFDISDFFLAS